MSVTAETLIVSPENATQFNLAPGSDRRADIDGKHGRVAALLREVGCEGLLILEPENFAWLASGATARSILDPAGMPALYFTPDQRWLLASNVTSQRLFDEEIDGLGFQLKEWPWHWGREPLLTELCQGRPVACDRALGNCKPIGEQLRRLRRPATVYEQACYRTLGLIISHALEATCRTMTANETEREIAGQLSHRLLHRGAQPVAISVAADGRLRRYRQCGFTAAPIRNHCVLTITARKYGLCATASRSVSFGPPDTAFRGEYDAACRITATYIACSWPDAVPREILNAGRRIYRVSGFEHDWLLGPQGHVTGRAPVELALLPETEELFQPGWAVTWCAGVGAAFSCDTFLITNDGPRIVTPTEAWPLKRIRIQGTNLVRPDLLQR